MLCLRRLVVSGFALRAAAINSGCGFEICFGQAAILIGAL
jgi:hypothetical protein